MELGHIQELDIFAKQGHWWFVCSTASKQK